MTPALQCEGLSAGYDEDPVLVDLNLTAAPQEVVAVLGPSGSGKSTLLATIAGFVAPRAGQVRLGGEVVADSRRSVPPEARDVAVVFQHGALWPHLSAVDTVAYPLRRQGMDVTAARREAAALLTRLGLAGLEHRHPAELSGGEQQRVGLARALARGGSLYLFDEPTAHLDSPLRASLLEEVAMRRAETGAAAIYATHDAAEALAVADRVALLRRGRVVQNAPPGDIYAKPVDLWAAQLTGPAAVLDIPARTDRPGEIILEVVDRTIAVPGGRAPGCADGAGVVLVRADWAGLGGQLPAAVAQTWYRGPHTDYRLSTPVGDVQVRQAGTPTANPGDRVTWHLRRAWVVPAG